MVKSNDAENYECLNFEPFMQKKDTKIDGLMAVLPGSLDLPSFVYRQL